MYDECLVLGYFLMGGVAVELVVALVGGKFADCQKMLKKIHHLTLLGGNFGWWIVMLGYYNYG